MIPEERGLLTILLDRPKRVVGQPKDPGPDRLIRELFGAFLAIVRLTMSLVSSVVRPASPTSNAALESFKPVLDPIERISEILFGLIMC